MAPTRTIGVAIMAALVVFWAVVSVWLSGWEHSFSVTMPLVLSLLWLAVFTLACYGAGLPAWRLAIGRPADSLPESVLVLGLGAGVLAACAGALSVAGLLTRMPVLLVLAVAAGGGGISLHRRWTGLSWPPFPNPHALVLVAAAVIAVLGASSLAAFYDQWNYHLAFPFQWLQEGGIVTFPRHAYSFFPANMGLLFTYGLAAGGGWTAQLIHLWMAGLSIAAAGSLAERFFPASGATAAVILASTPAVIELASVAGAELGVTAFFLCAWMALLAAADASDSARRWYVMAGIFIGLAVGSKYLAILLLAIPMGLILPLLLKSKGTESRPTAPVVKTLLIVTGTAILFWSPWAIRNVIETGDPVYPYLSGPVNSLDAQAAVDGNDLAEGIGGFGWNRSRLFFAATLSSFDSRDIGGRMGPLFLWLTPLWLFQLISRKTSPQERIFFLSLVLGLFGAAAVPSVGRYLLPLVAACAVGCGVSFQRLIRGLGSNWTAVVNTVLFVLLIGNLNPFPLGNLPNQIGVTLGIVDDTEFLNNNVSHYPAVEFINSELPEDAVVYFLAEARSYKVERRLLLEDPISKPLVVEVAESTPSTEHMIERFRSLGVTHILINHMEAKRMAAYNDRADYLSTENPAASRRVREFISGALPVVWHDRHLTLFRIPSTQGKQE